MYEYYTEVRDPELYLQDQLRDAAELGWRLKLIDGDLIVFERYTSCYLDDGNSERDEMG